MTHDKRITRLIHEAAAQTASDTLDLWPAIAAHVQPPITRPIPRRRGMFTLVAVILIVLAAGLIFTLNNQPDQDHTVHTTALSHGDDPGTAIQPAAYQSTPSASADSLCELYPQYCVPFAASALAPLTQVETSSNPRAAAMPPNAAGVVRGIALQTMPFIGSPMAPVDLLVFADFFCPHCIDYHAGDLERIIQDFVLTGQARLSFAFTTGTGGELSKIATTAALCAGEQNALWEMTDTLFRLEYRSTNPDEWTEQIKQAALSLGLDADTLAECMQRDDYGSVIDNFQNIAQFNGITGVPSVLFGTNPNEASEKVDRSYDSLSTLIREANAPQPPAAPFAVLYFTDLLDLSLRLPSGMTVYQDPTLHRPDLGVISVSFAGQESVGWSLTPNAQPPTNLVISVLRVTDPAALGLDATQMLSADIVLGALSEGLKEPDSSWVRTFGTQMPPGITLYMMFAPQDSDMAALNTTVFEPMLESAGIEFPTTVFVDQSLFSDEGVYRDSQTLTDEQRRIEYGVTGFSMPAQSLSDSGGYVVVRVEGEYYIPTLNTTLSYLDTGNLIGNYRTHDGAILMQWVEEGPLTNVNRNIVVEGQSPSLYGNYTLVVEPAGKPAELTEAPQPITLYARQPQTAHFISGEAERIRLSIQVGQYMDDADAVPYPDVAVILPDGVTLARFNPGQTQELRLDYTPTAEGEQTLLFYPLDTDETQDRREIVLVASVEPTGEPIVTETTSGTPTPLEGTIVLPEGTVAVSIPQPNYVIPSGEPADLVGQKVDVWMSFIIMDTDELRDPNGEYQIMLGPDGVVAENTQIVTQKMIKAALVVSAGPYLAPFTNEEPGLEWATGQEEWNALTLAVSPQDAQIISWAVEARIPLIVMPAEEN